MVASVARAKGSSVTLAGHATLAPDSRGGRNFEHLGEGSWLSGTLEATSVQGIQSQGVPSMINEFPSAFITPGYWSIQIT